jgi:hypothetical protein
MPHRFAHILVFECPGCCLPVTVPRVTHEKNLEGVDAEQIRTKCNFCDDWVTLSVVDAKRHYVEPWMAVN